MYRAHRRRKLITSNKAGKTEVLRHDKTGPTSPVFCFVRPETIRRVGQKLVKGPIQGHNYCVRALPGTPARQALPPIE